MSFGKSAVTNLKRNANYAKQIVLRAIGTCRQAVILIFLKLDMVEKWLNG